MRSPRSFAAFLVDHGHRDRTRSSWPRTRGRPRRAPLAAIDRLRWSPASADPVDAGRRLAAARSEATSALTSSALPPLRPVLRRLVSAAARGEAKREQAKATLVLGLSGLRAALFTAAQRLVDAGRLPDRGLLFIATREELADVLRDPEGNLVELTARRRRYDELNRRRPAFWFEGTIPDPDTWPARRGDGRG